jgi:hypothetical protein
MCRLIEARPESTANIGTLSPRPFLIAFWACSSAYSEFHLEQIAVRSLIAVIARSASFRTLRSSAFSSSSAAFSSAKRALSASLAFFMRPSLTN